MSLMSLYSISKKSASTHSPIYVRAIYRIWFIQKGQEKPIEEYLEFEQNYAQMNSVFFV